MLGLQRKDEDSTSPEELTWLLFALIVTSLCFPKMSPVPGGMAYALGAGLSQTNGAFKNLGVCTNNFTSYFSLSTEIFVVPASRLAGCSLQKTSFDVSFLAQVSRGRKHKFMHHASYVCLKRGYFLFLRG